jgi:hypothetical protein
LADDTDWIPPPEPVTWTIRPVSHGGTTYKTVTLRAPTSEDILKASANSRETGLAQALRLISAISEEAIPFEVLLKIPSWQIEQMTGYFESFSGAPLPDPLRFRAESAALSADGSFLAA